MQKSIEVHCLAHTPTMHTAQKMYLEEESVLKIHKMYAREA